MDDKDYLFRLVDDSGVTFNNTLNHTQELNPYTYRNYYNGAGTAIADFDNDGLEDLFFTGNQVANKIYRNLGNLKFEDMTHLSDVGCEGSWSTGVSVVDINNDGLKDIYICKAGPPTGARRHNELFINKGDFTFEEKAEEYGLRIRGFSVHASFFDFDRDGDLDCYLLNNSLRSVGGYDLRPGLRDIASEDGNMLLVNDGRRYYNRSKELGIYTSAIGFGLGVNTSDINGDGWTDIYVANDFFEKDYFYINQEGKAFIEAGVEYFNSYSMGSMGVDVADVDDDGDKDIFVAEMAPEGLKRKKTKATYESWNKYTRSIKSGYHHQYPRNMFHKNEEGIFVDISRKSKIESSEWSWAPLIFDMDNDGRKDLFISNGVGKDLLDRDYLAFMANEQQVNDLLANRNNESLKKLIDIMPSQKQENCFFKQAENGEFQKVVNPYLTFEPTTSNGTAIGDLDNDGDYDMIISNIDDKAVILENLSNNNYLKINLRAPQSTIGAEIILNMGDKKIYLENNPYRGFQSSLSEDLIAGLGSLTEVDEVVIKWSDGIKESFGPYEHNQSIVLEKGKGLEISESTKDELESLSVTLDTQLTVNYPSRIFNEFNKEKLLTSMSPSSGAVVDMKKLKDGRRLLVYGGAQNQFLKGVLMQDNQIVSLDSLAFQADFRSHVSDIHIFDSDNDGDMDIAVAHGSRVFSIYSTELHDGLYVNDGSFNFTYVPNAFGFEKPVVSSVIESYDFNNDGLRDVIIGEKVRDDVYGLGTRLFYFKNKGNNQYELTDTFEKGTGMISDLSIVDFNGDENHEIVVVGEWQSLMVLKVEGDELRSVGGELVIPELFGLWRDVDIEDVDGDGDQDLLVTNQGENSFLNGAVKLYVADFDENGRKEQITTVSIEGVDYPIHDYDELSSQLPLIRSKAISYKSYAEQSMEDLFDAKNLEKSVIRKLYETRSGVFFNLGTTFEFVPFPDEIQQSSMHAIEVSDVNKDGVKDVLIGGNHHLYKPQFGRDDASRGYLVLGDQSGGSYKWGDVKSLSINGEIREIISHGKDEYWISIHGEDLKKYKIEYEN